MSKQSVLSLAVTVNGDGLAENYTPPQSPQTNPNAPEGGPVAVALGSGSTTVPVPAGSVAALVVPLPTSVNAKALRTVSGDTGAAFTSQMQLVNVTGLSNIYLTATVGETISILWL